MKLEVTLVSFLVIALPFAETLGIIADKGARRQNADAGHGDEVHGVQFMSVLRRRFETTKTSVGGASLLDTAARIRRSRHVQVSRAQMTALRQYRSWTSLHRHRSPTRLKNASEMSMTFIRDLGPEYVGSIGIGTVGCLKSSASHDGLKETDCSHSRAQSDLTSVVFDTGSTNLWMASTLCAQGPCTNSDRHRYDPNQSITFHEFTDNIELEVQFGTASLKGPLGIDDFHIGPFTVKNQTFALIEEESGSTFRNLPLEGIVGLAFPSMSANGQVPFFDSVIKQKVLKKNMFCFYLNYGEHHSAGDVLLSDASHVSNTQGAKIGAILWGGYDESMFEGSLMWFPVTKAHYWAIDLLEFRIGNDTLPVSFENSGESLVQRETEDEEMLGIRNHLAEESRKRQSQSYLIVDTGTTYYTAQGELYHTLTSKLSTADCSNAEQHPPLTYVLKDIHGARRELTITPEDYMTTDGIGCELAFMKVGPPPEFGPAMLLGGLFMQKYFTVFDRGNGGESDARIGIARARNGAMSSLFEQTETKSRPEYKKQAVKKAGASVRIDDAGGIELDITPRSERFSK